MKTVLKISFCMFFFLLFTLQGIAQEGWNVQSSPINTTLNGVFFINPTTGFITGNTGTLLKTTNGGQNWTVVNTGTLESLYGICFTDSAHGFMCGSSGKVFKTTNGGSDWTKLSTGTSTIYHSLYLHSASEVYTVGESGKIAYTSNGGNSWTFQTNPATFGLYDINYDDPDHWVTGDGGMILRSGDGGLTWTQLITGLPNRLTAVYPRKPACIVTGSPGVVMKTGDNGQNWTVQYPTPSGLNDVTFPDNGNKGWIVGDNGKILVSADFGDSWSEQTSGTLRDLNAVFFINASSGWAVGGYGTILHYIGPAVVKTVYVDDDNTSGIEDGTLAHPFNTVAEGLNGAAVGDTVFIFCGAYPETPLTSLNLNAGIFITGEDSACTIIHIPFENTVPFTQYLTAITNVDCHSVTLHLLGGGTEFSEFYIGGSRIRHNLFFLTATKKSCSSTGNAMNSLQIENCTLEGDIILDGASETQIQITDNFFVNGGIRDNAGATSGTNTHIIENNVFHVTIPPGSADTVITVLSPSVTIQNNTLEITGKGTGMYLSSGNPTHVIGNTIMFNDPLPVEQTAGINTKAAEGIISNNTISGGYFGYISSSDATLFEYNSISKSHTGFMSSGKEKVRYNHITDCRGNGLIANGLKGPVENNTISGNDSTGVVVLNAVDLGGGDEDGEGRNVLQDNGTYDLVIRYQPAVPDTFFAMFDLWDYETEAEILAHDVLNEGGANLMVKVDNFITFPGIPVLQSPANNSTDVNVNPELTWNQTAIPDYYKLQISSDAGFTALVIDTGDLKQTFFTATLLPEMPYYWRVRAENPAGTGDWSETWKFTTGVAGVNEYRFNLIDITFYPNPARGVVQCRFGSSPSSFCRIEMVDLHGQSAGTIYEGKPASEDIVCDVSHLQAGVYIIRIIASETIISRKIIIL